MAFDTEIVRTNGARNRMTRSRANDWRDFQTKVADLLGSVPGCVAYIDRTVEGSRIGKVQVDVLAEFSDPAKSQFGHGRHHFTFKVIIECKFWKKRVPQEKVFALKTIVEDVGAAQGILVTEVGVQSGAKKYLAGPVNLIAVTFAELQALALGRYVVTCRGCGVQDLIGFSIERRTVWCKKCWAEQRRA